MTRLRWQPIVHRRIVFPIPSVASADRRDFLFLHLLASALSQTTGSRVMRLGDLLVARGLATPTKVYQALQRQRAQGGRIGTHLVAMGVLSPKALMTVVSDQRDIGSAVDLCEHALTRLRTSYGDDNPQTNRARYTLSRALFAAGQPNEAAGHAEAALAALSNALGWEHQWTKDAIVHAHEVREALSQQDKLELEQSDDQEHSQRVTSNT
ncbi:MAG: hypothetical protein JO032_14725 [Alphaproteobacteria bacterium]|nr:hypothetical protein [Alphaproteobacteria bacterium]